MGKIGPHEGKELELMLNNQKNIALFYTDYDIPEAFFPYLENNTFKLLTINLKDELIGIFSYLIIYKGEYFNELNRLVNLLKNGFGKFNPEMEREIGRLLGYNSDDIDFYINHCYKKNFVNFAHNISLV